jgi:hypothetical protein
LFSLSLFSVFLVSSFSPFVSVALHLLDLLLSHTHTHNLKPLADALFTEQDPNSQIGAALYLASVIDAAPDSDLVRLANLLPRFEKLLTKGILSIM